VCPGDIGKYINIMARSRRFLIRCKQLGKQRAEIVWSCRTSNGRKSAALVTRLKKKTVPTHTPTHTGIVFITEDEAVEDGEREKSLTKKMMMAEEWRTKARNKKARRKIIFPPQNTASAF
jgi:hypothetical protein